MDKLFAVVENPALTRLWKKEYRLPILAGFVLLLGVFLRLYDLGAESYWVDEMYTVLESQQSVRQILTSGRLDQPLPYYLPLLAWVKIFGAAEVSTRLFSALAGIGSIGVLYLIGRRLFGVEVGLIGAFLIAISDFQIYYSQEARFYAFFQLATLFSFLFFLLSFESKKRLHYALYCIASIIMIYSHTYGVFVLAAQNLFFTLCWKKHKDAIIVWMTCQVIIGLTFLPYFVSLVAGGSDDVRGAVLSNSTGTPLPSMLDPLRFIYRFIIPARETRDWSSVITGYIIAGIIIAAGAYISTVLFGKKSLLNELKGTTVNLLDSPHVKNKLILLSCWLLIPVTLPFILSFLIAPMYLDRYTICAAPAAYLLAAYFIFSVRKLVPVIVSLAALAVTIFPGMRYYYSEDQKEQWREVAAYVEENPAGGEMIVFAPSTIRNIQQSTFNWYYRGTLPACTVSYELTDNAERWNALTQCIDGRARFWVIIRDTSEPGDPLKTFKRFFLNLAQQNINLVKSRQFVDITVYLFEVRK